MCRQQHALIVPQSKPNSEQSIYSTHYIRGDDEGGTNMYVHTNVAFKMLIGTILGLLSAGRLVYCFLVFCNRPLKFMGAV